MTSTSGSAPTERDKSVRPTAAVSVVIFDSGRKHVLLTQRASRHFSGLWSLPGGHIEPGEKAKDAAIREIHEETQLKIELQDIVAIHDLFLRDNSEQLIAHYVICVFYAVHIQGTPKINHENQAVKWVAIEEIEHLDLTLGLPSIIARALEMASS